MSDFSVGDKVTCVDDKFDAKVRELYTALPVEGRTYVVRAVRLGIRSDCKTGDLSLLLVGLNNPHANSRSGLERGFSETRFRKPGELRTRMQEPATVADAVGKEAVAT